MNATQTTPELETKPAIPPTIRRIVLTGFMGSGKSTVGALLAERLGGEFLDLDAHIEARSGASVRELFANHGESHFRLLESTALANALGRSNVVLSLGGGAPEQLTNRLLIEQTPGTHTIFLDAPFPVLFDRCVLQAIARPVLADPAAAEARFHQRQPHYRRLARLTVDTSALSPLETAEFLVHSLKARK